MRHTSRNFSIPFSNEQLATPSGRSESCEIKPQRELRGPTAARAASAELTAGAHEEPIVAHGKVVSQYMLSE